MEPFDATDAIVDIDMLPIVKVSLHQLRRFKHLFSR